MDIEHAADALWAGIRRGEHMPADWYGRLSAREGDAVNLAILRRRIADGDAQAGWKVGLTSDAMRAQWGIPEPCFGVLLRSGHRLSGHRFDVAGLIAPGIENELCVTIGETLRGPAVTQADVARAIAAIEPALEVDEVRGDFSRDLPLAIADNAQQKAFVTGAATRFDAGLALEHGAASVTMFARRARLPQINKSKWTSFAGFFRGYPALPDAERLRFYAHVFDEQVPPPFESVLRCDRHAAFALRLGEPWLDVAADAAGVSVTTAAGVHRFDAVIFGTGFDVNLVDRPELGALAASVLAWGDRVEPEAGAVGAELARFPYLGDGFQLMAKDGTDPDVAEALGRIHLFSWGSTLSHGAVAGDIPGLAIGATRLAGAIVRDLFVEDAERHHARLLAHDEQELRPTRWWGGDAGPGPAGAT